MAENIKLPSGVTSLLTEEDIGYSDPYLGYADPGVKYDPRLHTYGKDLLAWYMSQYGPQDLMTGDITEGSAITPVEEGEGGIPDVDTTFEQNLIDEGVGVETEPGTIVAPGEYPATQVEMDEFNQGPVSTDYADQFSDLVEMEETGRPTYAEQLQDLQDDSYPSP